MGGKQSCEVKENVVPVNAISGHFDHISGHFERQQDSNKIVIILLIVICAFKSMEWIYYITTTCKNHLKKKYGAKELSSKIYREACIRRSIKGQDQVDNKTQSADSKHNMV